MLDKLTLYSYWRSSCSWRVRSVLAFKNISYEYKAVNVFTGEQFQPDYKEKNPVSQVPCLKVECKDGRSEYLIESLAIIDFLEHVHPTPSIYPSDPIQRAKVVSIVETIVSAVQPLQNLSVMVKVQELSGGSKEKSFEWSAYWIDRKFEYLEKLVKSTAGQYTVGNQLTLADMCLVPQVYNAYRFKVNMDRFPTLKRLYEFLNNVDSIKQARPDAMPDKPASEP